MSNNIVILQYRSNDVCVHLWKDLWESFSVFRPYSMVGICSPTSDFPPMLKVKEIIGSNKPFQNIETIVSTQFRDWVNNNADELVSNLNCVNRAWLGLYHSLINKPQLLILDQISDNFGKDQKLLFWSQLKEYQVSRNFSLIFVTSDLDCFSYFLENLQTNFYFLDEKGLVTHLGTSDELRNTLAHDLVEIETTHSLEKIAEGVAKLSLNEGILGVELINANKLQIRLSRSGRLTDHKLLYSLLSLPVFPPPIVRFPNNLLLIDNRDWLYQSIPMSKIKVEISQILKYPLNQPSKNYHLKGKFKYLSNWFWRRVFRTPIMPYCIFATIICILTAFTVNESFIVNNISVFQIFSAWSSQCALIPISIILLSDWIKGDSRKEYREKCVKNNTMSQFWQLVQMGYSHTEFIAIYYVLMGLLYLLMCTPLWILWGITAYYSLSYSQDFVFTVINWGLFLVIHVGVSILYFLLPKRHFGLGIIAWVITGLIFWGIASVFSSYLYVFIFLSMLMLAVSNYLVIKFTRHQF